MQFYPSLANESLPSTVELLQQHCERSLQAVGWNHCRLGAAVGQKWRLPRFVLTAMLTHHGWADPEQDEIDAYSDLLQFVQAASLLADYFHHEDKVAALGRLQGFVGEQWGFDEQDIQQLIEETHAQSMQQAAAFQLDAHSLREPAQLLVAANEQLADLTMRAASENIHALAERELLERRARKLADENTELEWRAERDRLTGVFNRQFFDEYFARVVEQGRYRGSCLLVAFLDVDHFKQINDTFNHAFGDDVLCHVARRIQQCLRHGDILARYGGEEFVLVAALSEADDGAGLMERIRVGVTSLQMASQGHSVPVTISAGAVTWTVPDGPIDRSWAASLVQLADEAMYVSRREGRNRVTQVCVPIGWNCNECAELPC